MSDDASKPLQLGWNSEELYGWGRYPRVDSTVARPEAASSVAGLVQQAADAGDPALAYGLGRSYGDVALLRHGRVVRTTRLDRMLEFDPSTGRLRCEAGVSLTELLDVFVPRGFFPAVLPGTCQITVGGAIANDIHGKNHHADGTFCDHVISIDLLLACGDVVTASRDNEPELFWATIGGMGLTGVILAAEMTLTKVAGPWLETESIRVNDLDHFFELSSQSSDFTHVVTWIDTLAKGRRLGRGILMRGRHATVSDANGHRGLLEKLPLQVPVDLPNFVLNPLTLRAFNGVYFRKQWRAQRHALMHYKPWLFPLDAVANWNRAYGSRGMIQYQVVVPPDPNHAAIRSVVGEIAKSGMGSFLAVIKEFGETDHGGLSFPMPGVTLSLDFPNYGRRLFELLDRVDPLVADAGGRVYLGKDARLSKDMFRAMYPRWHEWKQTRDAWDPSGQFQSELGRRLGLVDSMGGRGVVAA